MQPDHTDHIFRRLVKLIGVLATQFEVAQPPSDAISAIAFAPESPNRFVVSSWDKNVYLYEISGDDDERNAQLVQQFEHRAPVIDVCFGADDNETFTAGVDRRVTR